jgi:hypothetical protein
MPAVSRDSEGRFARPLMQGGELYRETGDLT